MLGGKCRIGQRGLLHSFDEANQGGAEVDPSIIDPSRKRRRPLPVSRLPSRFRNGPSGSPSWPKRASATEKGRNRVQVRVRDNRLGGICFIASPRPARAMDDAAAQVMS
jgi:hypothetical protein